MTKTTPPARLPLVEAIKTYDAAAKDVAGKQRILANARRLLAEAEGKLVEARAECEAAKEEHTARVMDAASTSSDLKPSARLRTARIGEAEAEDECEAARAAVAKMEEGVDYGKRYDGASYDPASIAHRDLEDVADGVIRSEIDPAPLFREIDDLLVRLCDKRQAAIYLVSQNLVPAEHLTACKAKLRSCSIPYVELTGSSDDPKITSIINTALPTPSMDAWMAARKALLTDPATQLPGAAS